MKNCAALLILAVLVAAGRGGSQSKEDKGTPALAPSAPDSMSVTNLPRPEEEKPLLLDDDQAPLLLGDAPATNAATEPGADNNRCQVCHLNMVMEELSVIHARTNIGCANCHGPSDAHIADESWASGGNGTAPELMYPKHKINLFCRECHKEAILTRESSKPCPKLLGVRIPQKYCTDCHGKHRLVERKCKWK